jgi:protoheme ferro-lyase
MTRAEAVNADPLFIDMMADVVERTVARYPHRPLPLVPSAAGEPVYTGVSRPL